MSNVSHYVVLDVWISFTGCLLNFSGYYMQNLRNQIEDVGNENSPKRILGSNWFQPLDRNLLERSF